MIHQFCTCGHSDGQHFDGVGACAECTCVGLTRNKRVRVVGPFPETVDRLGNTWEFWPWMAIRQLGTVILTGRGYTPGEAVLDLHDTAQEDSAY